MYEVGLNLHPPELESDLLPTEIAIVSEYQRLGIEASLAGYIEGGGGDFSEDNLSQLLTEYSNSLAVKSLIDDPIDFQPIRFGVELLTQNMNEVCSAKFGYRQPTRFLEKFMIKTGLLAPQTCQYIRKLDDRYWDVQFPEEYRTESLVSRLHGEPEDQYLARYIQASIDCLIFAPFTYMRSPYEEA